MAGPDDTSSGAVNPLSYIFWADPSGENLSYDQLKQRRAIAAAMAMQQRKYPQNAGEGMTYLGEKIGEGLYNRSLAAAERASRDRDAALEKAAGITPSIGPGGVTPQPRAPANMPPALPQRTPGPVTEAPPTDASTAVADASAVRDDIAHRIVAARADAQAEQPQPQPTRMAALPQQSMSTMSDAGPPGLTYGGPSPAGPGAAMAEPPDQSPPVPAVPPSTAAPVDQSPAAGALAGPAGGPAPTGIMGGGAQAGQVQPGAIPPGVTPDVPAGNGAPPPAVRDAMAVKLAQAGGPPPVSVPPAPVAPPVTPAVPPETAAWGRPGAIQEGALLATLPPRPTVRPEQKLPQMGVDTPAMAQIRAVMNTPGYTLATPQAQQRIQAQYDSLKAARDATDKEVLEEAKRQRELREQELVAQRTYDQGIAEKTQTLRKNNLEVLGMDKAKEGIDQTVDQQAMYTQALDLIDKGVITGSFRDLRLNMAKLNSLAGQNPAYAELAKNTELLRRVMVTGVNEAIKNLRPASDTDRKMAAQQVGADPDLEKWTIKDIVNWNIRKNNQKITDYDQKTFRYFQKDDPVMGPAFDNYAIKNLEYIPQAHKDMLVQNQADPNRTAAQKATDRRQFDDAYGPGTADMYLGGNARRKARKGNGGQ